MDITKAKKLRDDFTEVAIISTELHKVEKDKNTDENGNVSDSEVLQKLEAWKNNSTQAVGELTVLIRIKAAGSLAENQ